MLLAEQVTKAQRWRKVRLGALCVWEGGGVGDCCDSRCMWQLLQVAKAAYSFICELAAAFLCAALCWPLTHTFSCPLPPPQTQKPHWHRRHSLMPF